MNNKNNSLIHLIDETSHTTTKNTSIDRMISHGFTKKEIAKFKYAIKHFNDKVDLMKSIKCRCTDTYECERCNMLRLQNQFSSDLEKHK